MPSLYCGCAYCTVDAEGVIELPESEAEAIDLPADEELLLSTHESDRCLVGYGRDRLAAMRERAERRLLADEAAGNDEREHLRRSRRMFGLVERAARVRGGLRIPPAMRHLGKIGDAALLVGAGDRFEIWNPWLAAESDDPAFSALAAFRMRHHRRHARAGSRRPSASRGGRQA